MRLQRTTVLGLVAMLLFASVLPANAKAKRKATNGEVCTIVGTSKADRINGTSKRDVICGLGGNDIIKGFGGNDVIDGGKGNDKIYGGAGNDIVFASTGNDLVQGNPGDDLLAGGTGKDSVDGGTGNDVCMYDLKDSSRLSCSSSQVGLGNLGISFNVSQSGATTIFSGKNSSSTARFLKYDYAAFNLKGQSECGGGGDLGWVLAGNSFKFTLENRLSNCSSWSTFGSLNVTASSTVTYNRDDSYEIKVTAANQTGLQVTLGARTDNCLAFTADSSTLSGQLRFYLNEYDDKGLLTSSNGVEDAPDLAFESWEPIVIRPGIQTSGCIGIYREIGPTLRVVAAYVLPDVQ
jgi:Ca2+-binding RTX toxin-like protein